MAANDAQAPEENLGSSVTLTLATPTVKNTAGHGFHGHVLIKTFPSLARLLCTFHSNKALSDKAQIWVSTSPLQRGMNGVGVVILRRGSTAPGDSTVVHRHFPRSQIDRPIIAELATIRMALDEATTHVSALASLNSDLAISKITVTTPTQAAAQAVKDFLCNDVDMRPDPDDFPEEALLTDIICLSHEMNELDLSTKLIFAPPGST